MRNTIQNIDQLEFAIFCIENIASAFNKSAAEVYTALAEKSGVLNNYIVPSYGPLHTQSRNYIVNDILDAAREEGVEI